jgi:hypothetical protein
MPVLMTTGVAWPQAELVIIRMLVHYRERRRQDEIGKSQDLYLYRRAKTP